MNTTITTYPPSCFSDIKPVLSSAITTSSTPSSMPTFSSLGLSSPTASLPLPLQGLPSSSPGDQAGQQQPSLGSYLQGLSPSLYSGLTRPGDHTANTQSLIKDSVLPQRFDNISS